MSVSGRAGLGARGLMERAISLKKMDLFYGWVIIHNTEAGRIVGLMFILSMASSNQLTRKGFLYKDEHLWLALTWQKLAHCDTR